MKEKINFVKKPGSHPEDKFGLEAIDPTRYPKEKFSLEATDLTPKRNLIREPEGKLRWEIKEKGQTTKVDLDLS